LNGSKLTIDEQIADMQAKGITFSIVNPKDVKSFLKYNNCLLNSLKAPYHVTIHKTKEMQFELSKIKAVSSNARDKWMIQHKDYFEKNQTIKESYSFVAKTVNYFCNKYRK
jgi:hypothetical protein